MHTPGLGGRRTPRRRMTSFGALSSNATPQFDATTRERHLIAVDVVRRYACKLLPDTVTRWTPALDPIALRRTAREVPVVIHHTQDERCPITTTTFLGFGPEDDCAYDPTGPGARNYYSAKTNPAGIKINLTHKYAQICDLIVTLEAITRTGEVTYAGVPIAGLLPGLYAQATMTYGHEAMHAAQYKMRPAPDPDSHRGEIANGRASEALIEGARWKRAYEEEASAWGYAFANTMHHELASLVNVFPLLRLNMPELFAAGGRYDLLGAGRPNEYLEHYLRDRIAEAQAFVPGGKLVFRGVAHLLMDAMVDVPVVTNAVIDACDAFEAGRAGRADVEEAFAAADHAWRDYFEHEDTPRMLSCRPFIDDIRPRLAHELARARTLLGG